MSSNILVTTIVSTWIVKNINLAETGQAINLSGCEIDGKSNLLRLYPGGIDNYENYILLEILDKYDHRNYRSYACLVNTDGNEGLHFSFSFINNDPYFLIERSKITSDFLPSGDLTVRWTFYYRVGEEHESLPKEDIDNMTEKCRQTEFGDFKNILKDDGFSDVKIVVDEQTFFVHKCVLLASQSRYFAAIFESSTKEEKRYEIHITDISANVIQEVLRFIYTGTIDRKMIMITDLLIAADKYGLDRLSAMCEEEIMSNTSLENIESILTVIDGLGNVGELKTFAIEFLTKNAKTLCENESFRKVLHSLSHAFVVEILTTMMSKI